MDALYWSSDSEHRQVYRTGHYRTRTAFEQKPCNALAETATQTETKRPNSESIVASSHVLGAERADGC